MTTNLYDIAAQTLAQHGYRDPELVEAFMTDPSGLGWMLVALAYNTQAEASKAAGVAAHIAYEHKLTLLQAIAQRYPEACVIAPHAHGDYGKSVLFARPLDADRAPRAGVQFAFHLGGPEAAAAEALGAQIAVEVGHPWSRRPLKPVLGQLLAAYAFAIKGSFAQALADVDAVALAVPALPRP